MRSKKVLLRALASSPRRALAWAGRTLARAPSHVCEGRRRRPRPCSESTESSRQRVRLDGTGQRPLPKGPDSQSRLPELEKEKTCVDRAAAKKTVRFSQAPPPHQYQNLKPSCLLYCPAPRPR